MSLISESDKNLKGKFTRILIYVILAIWVSLFLFPFYWMVRSSLSNKVDVHTFSIIPKLPEVITLGIEPEDFREIEGEIVLDNNSFNSINRDAVKIILFTFTNLQRVNQINLIGSINDEVILYLEIDRIKYRSVLSDYHNLNNMVDAADEVMDRFNTRYYDSNKELKSLVNLKNINTDSEYIKQVISKFDKIELDSNIHVYSIRSSFLRMFDSFRMAWVAFGDQSFSRFFLNSIIYVGGAVSLNLIISSLAAYPLSKIFKKRISGILLFYYIITMMIPEVLLFIPLFLMMKEFPFPFLPNVNLINTYMGLILPHAAWGFSILLFKGFFDRIPTEIIEAARIDGASEFKIFIRLVTPLSKSVFAVVGIFGFVATWMNFLWPYIITQKRELWTFTVALFNLQQSPELMALGSNTVMAALTISLIPSLLIFLSIQKFIQEGIALEGLKG